MKFYYHEEASARTLTLEGEIFHQLVRVKRQKSGMVDLVNFKDGAVYTYEISARARQGRLSALLVSSQHPQVRHSGIHLAWAVVDPKTLEKTIPFLNELGVEKLSFVWTHRSQRNFAPNLSRLEKIAINSSCQCGRVDLMSFEVFASLSEFLSAYPGASYLDFGGAEKLSKPSMPLLIGAEGGFASQDLDLLRKQRSFRLDHALTLKSQTAIIAAAASFIFV